VKIPKKQLAALERVVAKAPRRPGIYRLLNITLNRSYVGQARNLRQRLNRHLAGLRRGGHDQWFLQQAFALHGPEHWEFHIVRHCDVACSGPELTELEAHYIARFNALADGYNCAPPRPGMKGTKAFSLIAKKAATGIQGRRSPEERAEIAARAAQTRKERLLAVRRSEAARKAWVARKSAPSSTPA